MLDNSKNLNMSTQTNQYFMYGILMPYEWHKKWEKETGKDFYNTFENFMHTNAYTTKVEHRDGIFCLFDGRDGSYIIIGKVLEKTDDDDPFLGLGKPIRVPDLGDVEKTYIENSVFKHFGLGGEFHFYFVTHLT